MLSNIPIYVITLPESKDRQQAIQSQLSALNLPFTFFDAVDGRKTPDHPLFKKYNDKKRVWRRGKAAAMRPSQLGCFASHYLLWQQCVADGKPIIVLEDDATLLEPFARFCERMHEFAKHHDLMWLHSNSKRERMKGRVLENTAGFKVVRFPKGYTITVGYMLTPKGASTLLAHAQEWVYPVDITMDRFFEHHLDCVSVEPFVVGHDEGFESAINPVNAQPQRRTFAERVRREFYSLVDTLKRTAYNLRFVVGAWFKGIGR